VLDVGAGQGTQALRLAGLGHQVVALEPDPAMREQLRRALDERSSEHLRVDVLDGGLGALPTQLSGAAYDVVLCQGVLMYLPESGPALAELAGLVAPGGLLSLVFRNAQGIALRPAIRRDWAQVQALLDAADDPNPLYLNEIGVNARADRLADVERGLAAHGLATIEWHGVRIATDAADAEEPAPQDPDELEAMLATEQRLGRTDPYRRVATLVHLLSRRPA
jgi:S-adenosylmethionine-dependent methyltransferase